MPLFVALTRKAKRHKGNLNPQDLANTVWAFATAGRCDAKLFVALANMVERHMAVLDAQGLANTT